MQILMFLTQAGAALRAGTRGTPADLERDRFECAAPLGANIDARHVKGMRSQAKEPVGRRLVEPETGQLAFGTKTAGCHENPQAPPATLRGLSALEESFVRDRSDGRLDVLGCHARDHQQAPR